MRRDLAPVFSAVLGSVVAGIAACGGGIDGNGPSLFDAGDATPTLEKGPSTGPCPPISTVLTVPPSACANDESRAAVARPGPAPLDPIDAGACSCATVCTALSAHADGCRFVSSEQVLCGVDGFCGGRRPESLAAPRLPRVDRRTAYLVGCAHLEAASVIAFERLARELARLDAPASLVARLRAAAADEVRHAATVLALSGEHALPAIDLAPERDRSVLAIAIENAREGCVRETFAALIARRQAAEAEDADARRAMQAIADDETRHAELSWELGEWLERHLDDEGRTLVESARREEIRALREEVASRGYVDRALGLPDAREATRLVDALFVALAA